MTTALQSGVQIKPFSIAAGNTGEQRFYELAANGNNYVGFKAPDSVAANKVWTLPATDGTNGQVLTTNGSGDLSWASSGATLSMAPQAFPPFTCDATKTSSFNKDYLGALKTCRGDLPWCIAGSIALSTGSSGTLLGTSMRAVSSTRLPASRSTPLPSRTGPVGALWGLASLPGRPLPPWLLIALAIFMQLGLLQALVV